MRTSLIKDYLATGYIIYEAHTPYKVVCGAALPEEIARYVKLHNLDTGRAWISCSSGVYEVESYEAVAMDTKKFVMTLQTAVNKFTEEKQI